MRMLPSRYLSGKPLQVKRAPAQVRHVSAPLKGLSLSSKLVQGDALTAVVLDNWIVEEDRITCRAGIALAHDFGSAPVEQLVPYYGQPNKLAAATGGALKLLDGTLVRAGFTSDDWHWTAFSNLSSTDYTVLVNGQNGVWSWDGGVVADPAPVAVTAMTNANPCVVTVAAGDITKFANGQAVLIAGATGSLAAANGWHYIASVGLPVNSFTLIGVDTSGTPGTLGTVTADPPGSMAKEIVTAPPTATWINPEQMHIVLAHMNRLFFADPNNLAVYYLPVQQKSGELKVLPLNAVFRRGGTIRAMYTWTTEGGVNTNDQLVIFSSNGEAVIYAGTDPDTDFQLSGIFRFDSPMSKHSVVNYGGDLYCLISTGVVPFSTLLRAESEQLGKEDRNVFSMFSQVSLLQRDHAGWSVLLNPSSGRLIANMPKGGTNQYMQAIRFMPNPIWSTWSALPSRCWGWVDNRVYIGSDDGKVYEMHPRFLNDLGDPIKVDVQAAWSNYGTAAIKHFKMVLAYLITDGTPRPFVDVKVDYDTTPPNNQPDVTFATQGATWDLATWDVDSWQSVIMNRNNWSGVGAIGRVGGPRLTALVVDCNFSLTGWDVLFEGGSLFG